MRYVIRGLFGVASGPNQLCTLGIWQRSWLGETKSTIDCEHNHFTVDIIKPVPKDRKKRQVVGGARAVAIDDEEVNLRLNRAVASIAAGDESRGQFT